MRREVIGKVREGKRERQKRGAGAVGEGDGKGEIVVDRVIFFSYI